MDRCEGRIGAEETPIGYVPRPEDIDIEGTDLTRETLRGLLSVDKEMWRAEAADIEKHYEKFGPRLPKELRKQLDALEKRLSE